MKSTHTVLPKSLRLELDLDPRKNVCAFKNFPGHVCGGRITREHALYFAGRKIQKRYAIVFICAKGHGVDQFQDHPGQIPKDAREWVALSQATDAELAGISKGENKLARLTFLRGKYGTFIQPATPKTASVINYYHA